MKIYNTDGYICLVSSPGAFILKRTGEIHLDKHTRSFSAYHSLSLCLGKVASMMLDLLQVRLLFSR